MAEDRFFCMVIACRDVTMTTITKILSILMITTFLLVTGTGGAAFAAAVAPSPQDEALLALINEARRNPLAAVAAIGMDPEKVLRDLPELEKILREGLPPLTFNAAIFAAARAHTQDMLANNYYSHVSPDGRGYYERIRDAGYPAGETGESLGMLYFANFIKPAVAVQLLFEYLYRDELDPARTETRNILNPLLQEVGVSIDAGVMSQGGVLWNVYIATCDFGSVISGSEARLLQLVNQARKNPLKAAADLGMDPDRVLADFPEWHDLLTQGLSPYTFNSNLAEAARKHARDMLANGYYSHDSSDGRTYEDRIRAAGYDPLQAGESLFLACLGNDRPENYSKEKVAEILQVIFRDILTRELSPYFAGQRNILNASLKEVGIGYALGQSQELGSICGKSVLLMVADFGSRSE
jgi:hypothetical protein